MVERHNRKPATRVGLGARHRLPERRTHRVLRAWGVRPRSRRRRREPRSGSVVVRKRVMYDAIIVGARCAGSSVGMLLARRGHRVLIVDRAHFPSEIPQGHFIHRHGPRRLHDWGLGARVAGMCPPITATTLDVGDFPLSADGLLRDGIPLGYAPRRARLDSLLLEAAIEAGAEVRQSWTVDEFITHDDRIVGVRGRHGDARSLIERAKVVVGADGRNSRLAKFVRAAMYECHESLTCWY